MKLIIYWLTIMAILPLIYLWLWKKQQRLILGVIILALVGIGFFITGEITFSILAREIEKESKNKVQKTDDIINSVANQKSDSENSEKIEQAKEIVKLSKELEPLERNHYNRENYNTLNFWKNQRDLKKQSWIRKWTQEKFLSVLLFCGEEFTNKLASKEYEDSKKKVKIKIATENVIDFANYRDSTPEKVKEKILDTIKKEKEEQEKNILEYNDFSIIWLKNIDQITSSELRQWLLEVFDVQKDSDFWKYKDKDNNEITPDLLKLIFILTTSNYNPKYLNDYKQKLNHIEPILDKYFWTIIFSSAVVEIIIFMLLIRNKKKSENKAFKKFGY